MASYEFDMLYMTGIWILYDTHMISMHLPTNKSSYERVSFLFYEHVICTGHVSYDTNMMYIWQWYDTHMIAKIAHIIWPAAPACTTAKALHTSSYSQRTMYDVYMKGYLYDVYDKYIFILSMTWYELCMLCIWFLLLWVTWAIMTSHIIYSGFIWVHMIGFPMTYDAYMTVKWWQRRKQGSTDVILIS